MLCFASDCPHRMANLSTALPYLWRQELGDLDVTVPVPKGTRGKDLDIKIQKKFLSVSLKGKEKILEGELAKDIKVEDSTWTIGTWPFLYWNLKHADMTIPRRGPTDRACASGESR